MKGPAPSRPKKPPSPQKLTLLCIFRGAFVRRSTSGELSYVDGENRLISVDRRGGVAMSKLAARIADLCPGCSFSLKYQLPEASSAALPKLIPIATDEDVRRMVEEHDRIAAEQGRAPRLRIYLCDVRPLPVNHVESRYFSSGGGIGSCSRLGGSNGEKCVLDRGSALGDLNERFHARKYANFGENLGNKVRGNQLGNYETCGHAHLVRFNHLGGSTASHPTQVPYHGFSPSISHKAENFPIKNEVIIAAKMNCENAIDHKPIQTCLAPPTISSQSSHKRNPQWKFSGSSSRGLLGVSHSTTRNSRLGVGGNGMRHNQTVYCDVQGQKIGSDGFVVQRFDDDKVRELKYHLGTRRRSGNSKLAHSRAHLHQLANAASSKDICSKEVGEAKCKLSAIYSLLAAQELQAISNSDLEEIRELGSGNFGTVFYGKWRGSDVAIKRLKPICLSGGESGEEKMVMDFWKEARLLGQLHHPNVVAFYGVVADEPARNLALVTEYMVNGSLKQVLKRKDRTIDRRKRVLIAMDAAFGMEYLHEKNIVHFDLKSHNFFMNMRDPHRPVCKIGDLGLSKVKQRTLVSGGIRGTIPWMAPELFSCTKNMVTEKVDVYSFGIVMWELLTGEEPYENLRSDEIIAGIIKGGLRPNVPSWCDPAWKSLMERCWSSDPKARPSFTEIAKELRDIAESMNIKY